MLAVRSSLYAFNILALLLSPSRLVNGLLVTQRLKWKGAILLAGLEFTQIHPMLHIHTHLK